MSYLYIMERLWNALTLYLLISIKPLTQSPKKKQRDRHQAACENTGMRTALLPREIGFNADQFLDQDDTISPLPMVYSGSKMTSSRYDSLSLSDLGNSVASFDSHRATRTYSAMDNSISDTTMSNRSMETTKELEKRCEILEKSCDLIKHSVSPLSQSLDKLLNFVDESSKYLSRFTYSMLEKQSLPLCMDSRNKSGIKALCHFHYQLTEIKFRMDTLDYVNHFRRTEEHLVKLSTKIRNLHCFFLIKLFFTMMELEGHLKNRAVNKEGVTDSLKAEVTNCEHICDLIKHLKKQRGSVIPSDQYFTKKLNKACENLYIEELPKTLKDMDQLTRENLEKAKADLYPSALIQNQFNENEFLNNAFFLSSGASKSNKPGSSEDNQPEHRACFEVQCVQS